MEQLFVGLNVREVQPDKIIESNNQLLKDLLNEVPEFRKWTYQKFDRPLNLEKLSEQMARKYIEYFDRTMTSPYRGKYQITDVLRVENPFLFAQYHLKKTQVNFDEILLFHGTLGRNLIPICTNNFNWRLKGAKKGCRFGQGVCFSPRSDYSKHSVEYFHYLNVPELNTEKRGAAMIIANVLTKKKYIGNRFTVVPIDEYDTTSNMAGTVYVKYQDSEFYPALILLIKLE
ncbi:protein mono-ADP-ribosyltransferase TIPARP-like [Aethina tumida]|uniref:protein mono-ADP-ribosyltransferase TIPARP-like n=1 Tax=Aethina tumida TaxID=116153 RepID=UPI00214781FF|nr:protein mono-ADP-ribosyltransferase TIPARP-like [Aethina tumida]